MRPGFQKYFTHLKYATIFSNKHTAKGYESAVIQLSINLILLRSIQSIGGSYWYYFQPQLVQFNTTTHPSTKAPEFDEFRSPK